MAVTFILGETGSGKTRLAGTWPATLWLNAEGSGNLTALRGHQQPPTIDVELSRSAIENVVGHLDQIRALEPVETPESGLPVYEYQGHRFKSVVLDSFDAIQDIGKMIVLGKRYSMNWDDWGELETRMRPILIRANVMPMPMVIVAHVRTTERGDNRYGIKEWSARGSITDRMDRVADEILHVCVINGKRRLATQKDTLLNGYQLLAKDRHEKLRDLANKDGWVDIHGEDGYPTTDVAKAITGEAYEPAEDTE